ncbi:hypothetical protein GCM10023238_36530 [Streptomyces heliomycini]
MSEETAEQVRELVTKGAMGGWLVLTTDDCRKTYETLLEKGVEFTEEPTERPYGIDCGLRDPLRQPHPLHPAEGLKHTGTSTSTNGRTSGAYGPSGSAPETTSPQTASTATMLAVEGEEQGAVEADPQPAAPPADEETAEQERRQDQRAAGEEPLVHRSSGARHGTGTRLGRRRRRRPGRARPAVAADDGGDGRGDGSSPDGGDGLTVSGRALTRPMSTAPTRPAFRPVCSTMPLAARATAQPRPWPGPRPRMPRPAGRLRAGTALIARGGFSVVINRARRYDGPAPRGPRSPPRDAPRRPWSRPHPVRAHPPPRPPGRPAEAGPYRVLRAGARRASVTLVRAPAPRTTATGRRA